MSVAKYSYRDSVPKSPGVVPGWQSQLDRNHPLELCQLEVIEFD